METHGLELKSITHCNGKVTTYLQKKNAAGRKLLLAAGYRPGNNPAFLIRGNSYAHYNDIMKVWLIEEA